MKTDDLIAMLASGPDVAAAPPPGARWRTAATLGAGLLASVALMAALLGVRPNLAQLALQPDFWIKVAFVASVCLAAWHASRRLGVPGANINTLLPWLALPLLLMWAPTWSWVPMVSCRRATARRSGSSACHAPT